MIPEIVTAFGFGSKSRFDHFIETNELTLSGSLVLSAILSQQIESARTWIYIVVENRKQIARLTIY